MTRKSNVLSILARDDLKQIVDDLEIDGVDRRSVEAMRTAIARSRKATAEVLLGCFGKDGLKEVCEAVGVSPKGRRDELVERLLGNGKPQQGEQPTPSSIERRSGSDRNRRGVPAGVKAVRKPSFAFGTSATHNAMTLNQADIHQARRHLRAADPVMRAVIDAVGPFTLRLERHRFAMLVRSIISQQISTNAARSIRRRLQELAPDMTAANLAQFTVDQLRSVGLSPQKASYIADLANKVNDGTVDLRQIGRLSDERVVQQLTQVRGIGHWTAQMFLIFSLGRLDVFPHGDLGVRTAIRDRYGLADLPDKQTAMIIAAPWRPYASVASWYCWRTLDWKREQAVKG